MHTTLYITLQTLLHYISPPPWSKWRPAISLYATVTLSVVSAHPWSSCINNKCEYQCSAMYEYIIVNAAVNVEHIGTLITHLCEVFWEETLGNENFNWCWSDSAHYDTLAFLTASFLLLVCELFRAHEMRSQLEVTKMLECKSKPYCVAPSFQRNTLLHKSCGLSAYGSGVLNLSSNGRPCNLSPGYGY